MSIPAAASSYDLGDAHSELDKLKGVLQKLQAENISLKAQVGSMTDDEKDVQRQLGVVVAEIGRLSSELSVQRQHVLEAKNRLLEASAELKSQKEHKRYDDTIVEFSKRGT
jgi:chromosome segregation ATPase